MGEIKELEEARIEIAIRFHTADRSMVRIVEETSPINCSWEVLSEHFQKQYLRQANQILNLKGADWKIAIVGNWSYTNPDGNKYAQVIWQAGE